MRDMRELSGEEVEGLVNGWARGSRGNWNDEEGKRNGFAKETWDQILNGTNKLLIEAEDYPHLGTPTFQQYANREIRLRWLENPRILRPAVRRHISDPHAIIIDYRQEG